MKNIIWKRSDGGIAVTWVMNDISSEAEARRLLMTRDVPLDWEAVEFDAEIPPDRTFRDAWFHDGKIRVDMEKAKDIWREKIRADRKPILESLDVAFIRALETGDAELVGDIRAQKQALRDATDDPVVDAAATPEELKAAIPEVLKIK